MAFRRPGAKGHDLILVSQPVGVLVAGEQSAVATAVARLLDVGGSGARSVPGLGDLAAVASTVAALGASHGEYVRLTERSLELLKAHGLVPHEGGSFWGFVRDSKQFRGNLDFEKVSFGPEQMLALQTAAVGFAIRASIKEVQAAVERVEGKVDDVLALLRSERLGDVLGTRRMMHSLSERARADGAISATDWSSVATIGQDAARDIEALRFHIRTQLEGADGGWRPGERVNDAERLFEKRGLLSESLALLLVAEHNLGAWHELRIAHVASHEPAHLSWTIEDAQRAIQLQYDDDQSLADALRFVADRLTTPAALDGLAPWQRGALTSARTQLDDLVGWFADQRLLDVAPLEASTYPSAKESIRHIRRGLSELAGRSLDVARERTRRDVALEANSAGLTPAPQPSLPDTSGEPNQD